MLLQLVSESVEGLHGTATTGNRIRTSVSGVIRRNQVPRLKAGNQWGYISYTYPRTARATASRNTSTTGKVVGPKLPRSTTYGCVHYRAHYGDLTTKSEISRYPSAVRLCWLLPCLLGGHTTSVEMTSRHALLD
jgi:hypothetical protein